MIKHLNRQVESRVARRPKSGAVGFTLIELLAVIVVIVLLAGIMLGVAGYVQNSIAISSTKTQLAAIQAGLEAYKSDWGAYPATGPGRISNRGDIEGSNNFILYNGIFEEFSG